MDIIRDDSTVLEQTTWYIKDCVTKFRELRPNRAKTKEIFSPYLTGISKCSSFQDLIHLCSEHDPTILKSVLEIALEKCAKAEEQMNKEKESKKRAAETQLGSEHHKKVKIQRLGQANTAISHESQVFPGSAPISKVRLLIDALKSGVTANQDSTIVSQASTVQRPSAVVVQASAGSTFQSHENLQLNSSEAPALHLASVSKDVVPRCDQESRAEDSQDWTGVAFDLESEEDMAIEADTRQEDSDLQETSPDLDSHDWNSPTENAGMSPHTRSNGSELFVPGPNVEAVQSMKTTLESTSRASPLRSSVTVSPPSQKAILTDNPTKTQTPTIYEVERGLVRGVEKIREYVMRECLCFSESCRAKKWYKPEEELRKLLPTFQKLPFEIVKNKLLVELESRIMVPGQKTAIPSTVDLFNPSDILDALQCIKMTTINAKVNRAYGQMRLFKSVQGKINGGYVLDNALTHGVAAHTSILAKMACLSAGNVSEKERSERRHSFDYEYDAGKKWVDVTKWFGGEGIVLIFVTAG